MSAPGFDFDYRVCKPGPPLAPFVELLWYARGTVPYTRERIAPTGSTVAIFVLGDAIIETPDNGEGTPVSASGGLILGPHVRPVVNEPTGETYAVGIVSSPVGCQALFHVEPATLRGQVRHLESVWPESIPLRRALMECGEPEGMFACIEAALQAGLDLAVPGWERCAAAIEQLEAEPLTPVADIAEQLGVSHGHLDREFDRVVGLSPRALSRLLRLRRLLGQLDVRGKISWAQLAVDHGWFDQAHLIRDFKRHTGVTPSAYVAAQRASFAIEAPGDGAGFVPEV